MFNNKYDVAIVGGGVIGCAIARELAKYQLKILLIEKEPDVATGTTKANTAIIHAGYNADPLTQKGKLNMMGNQMFDQITKELHVPFKRIGSLVVAVEGDDVSVLDRLYQRGVENGVPGLEIVQKDWLRKNEPEISQQVVSALYAPTAGIICPWELTLALAENAVKNGVEVLLETEVQNVITEEGRVIGVQTNRGLIQTDYIINAAGLFADDLARMVGIEKISITPRIGEYYVYDKERDFDVNHTIFPIPNQISKGTIVTPTVDGNLMIGPTSEGWHDKKNLATTREGLHKVVTGAKKLFPNITLKDTIRVFAGSRAADVTEDFVIEAADQIHGFINVAGIQSPGLSSAPSIAELIVQIVKDCGLKLVEKDQFDPTRQEPVRFRELSHVERAKLIEQDPRYGTIICRCETVTYKEILNAIHSPVGARTLDAVKRRTRSGMGRCQGGFCGPKVVSILAKELGINPIEVKKELNESQILQGKIKELLGSQVIDHA